MSYQETAADLGLVESMTPAERRRSLVLAAVSAVSSLTALTLLTRVLGLARSDAITPAMIRASFVAFPLMLLLGFFTAIAVYKRGYATGTVWSLVGAMLLVPVMLVAAMLVAMVVFYISYMLA